MQNVFNKVYKSPFLVFLQVYACCRHLMLKMTAKDCVKWKLGPVEYVIDQCVIASTILSAEIPSAHKHSIEMSIIKTV